MHNREQSISIFVRADVSVQKLFCDNLPSLTSTRALFSPRKQSYSDEIKE